MAIPMFPRIACIGSYKKKDVPSEIAISTMVNGACPSKKAKWRTRDQNKIIGPPNISTIVRTWNSDLSVLMFPYRKETKKSQTKKIANATPTFCRIETFLTFINAHIIVI